MDILFEGYKLTFYLFIVEQRILQGMSDLFVYCAKELTSHRADTVMGVEKYCTSLTDKL